MFRPPSCLHPCLFLAAGVSVRCRARKGGWKRSRPSPSIESRLAAGRFDLETGRRQLLAYAARSLSNGGSLFGGFSMGTSVSPVHEAAQEFPATTLRKKMRHIERREWMMWSSAGLVTILLTLGLASFAFPALLKEADSFYSFYLNHAIRGLVAMVLLFNVYTVYQQLQIHRLRRQMTEQILAVDKMGEMADEVYKLAVLDALTGLHNRRSAEQRLDEEIRRATRHKRPLTVLLLDLNGLKLMNDKHGHAAGDLLLRCFSERLKRSIRGSDFAARFGGDEFAAFLPECKPEEVHHVLQRLSNIEVDLGSSRVPLSFSAGWTDYVSGETAEDLLRRADNALYANKRAGKATPQFVPAVAGDLV
jgi:diguanylate cyclase (GGDEF)-like protein